jgi:chaperonin GroES
MNDIGITVGATHRRGAPTASVASDEDDGGQVMKLKPLGDRVVVKASEAEEQTKSGLFIPDTAKEKPQKGTVIAVGDGRWDEDGKRRIPLDVKAGDVVIYGKYGGQEIKVEGEDYLILSDRDIYAIVEGK